MKEIWKDIVGYEGLYQISNMGRVKSLNYNHTKKAIILKGSIDSYGYLMVCLYNNKISKNKSIHRLVIENFLLKPKGLYQANHKDGNIKNNKLSNLERCTASENIIHAYRILGRKPNKTMLGKTGSKSPFCKKTGQYTIQGKFIRQRKSVVDIHNKLGYDNSGISSCCKGIQKTAYGFIRKYI